MNRQKAFISLCLFELIGGAVWLYARHDIPELSAQLLGFFLIAGIAGIGLVVAIVLLRLLRIV